MMVDGGMVRAAAHSGGGTGRQISFHDVFQKEPASVAVESWT